MERINLDNILEIVNKEKERRNLEDYIPLYPMLRVEDSKLYIGVMLSHKEDKIWDAGCSFKMGYWALLDINNLNVIEINKTEDKEYISGIINSTPKYKTNEIVEYEENKKEEYQNYLMNDILNTKLPIYDKLFKSLNNKLYLEDKEVNINEYLKENVESIIKIKVKELVDILMQSKYGLITLGYENLYNEIIDIYKNKNIIDYEKLNICIDVMNNYYYGVIGIEDFFNLNDKEVK